jgi:hypothetical protein
MSLCRNNNAKLEVIQAILPFLPLAPGPDFSQRGLDSGILIVYINQCNLIYKNK